MNEFVNRMSAQRQILEIINRHRWPKEALFGLSRNAIERWMAVNHQPADSLLVSLVSAAAGKLFFLANKSQDQISEEYRNTSAELDALAARIKEEVAATAS